MENQTQGVLFAIRHQIFFFDPRSKEPPRMIAERPSLVTSLLVRRGLTESEKGFIGLDGCYDGKVRLNFESEVMVDLEDRVAGIVDLQYDSPREDAAYRHVNRALEDNPHKLLFVTTIGGIGGIAFRKFSGEVIGSETVHDFPQACRAQSNFFWCVDNTVYRGADKKTTDRAWKGAGQVTLVPYENNFLVCHHGNKSTHPEGYVLSTRDNRTVCTWDPDVYGSASLIGVYQVEGRHFLFFTDPHNHLMAHEEATCKLYTRPLRLREGESPFPQLLAEVTVPTCKAGLDGIVGGRVNAFFAGEIGGIKTVVDSLSK